jgi:hypothetical protein
MLSESIDSKMLLYAAQFVGGVGHQPLLSLIHHGAFTCGNLSEYPRDIIMLQAC